MKKGELAPQLKNRKIIKGKDHYNWQGGKTSLTQKIRNSKQMQDWRLLVFIKNHYSCVACGDNRGNNLNADHIIPLSYILKRYLIKTFDDALKCPIIWDTNNGRTLCISCHKKTDTWGEKAKNFTLN
ncbi:MAG TPA: HNH endonuclease signature motif containing protein [Patescibacteria group bacterium]